MSSKGFALGEYKLILAVLLIVVVGGVVVFSEGSPSGRLFTSPTTITLTVSTAGTGTGTVTGTGINCGSDCTETFSSPSASYILTATPASGSTIAKWESATPSLFGGAPSYLSIYGCNSVLTGSGNPTCTVSLTSNLLVRVTFTAAQQTTYSLTIVKAGAGSGTVSATGLSCSGTSCTGTYNSGTTVAVTATPDSNSQFNGWSGACAGTGTCSIVMSADKSAGASFGPTSTPEPSTHALTVTKSGTGSGTVSSNPAGINCGVTVLNCPSASFNSGATVTLTATPYAGLFGSGTGASTFGGWGGACSGTSTTCTVTMDAAKSVSAAFTLSGGGTGNTLTVTKSGTGSGTVSSNPAGINCGTTCSNTFSPTIAVVTLTANPASGSEFAGWSEATCPGTGTCTVSLTGAKTVTATFNTQSIPCPSSSPPNCPAPGVLVPQGKDSDGCQLPPKCEQPSQPQPTTGTRNLLAGWNLVSFPGDFTDATGDCTDYGQYNTPIIFFFDSAVQKYSDAKFFNVGSMPEFVGDKVNGKLNSFWAYVPENCALTFQGMVKTVGKGAVKIVQGWNFVPVTEDMVGSSLNTLGPGCGLVVAYGFDTANNKWDTTIKLDDVLTNKYSGLVVYSSGACLIS